ncbi:ricin B-like lectin EULS3 isoform X1 [Tripterygium wilfordii]|uniref:ricin B-like lectin EULS3 isoform X1 n=1 Tax=Tripterygium wilfordii TaxID=458696 RepID=UPI0018F84E13|nr:ricin B-like lectin EULS3 isoform X1 [Tripterygium wilfordii]XP_038694407.1 ricin B-like lectin EULS3 isoform X1 [Tripterygium wilfordii]XP_038694408.1 ricin B-like lectin EULS3 isoform X1 [Tripterygium wilfordii]XP_038694409.1 ricin B-like lectin EULS3 isoform X1 [Tripterygium wilfordii]
MPGKPCRIFNEAVPGCCLSIRHGKVILATTSSRDPTQHWYKNTQYAGQTTDTSGHHAFALVNKSTGEALRHPHGHEFNSPVELVDFVEHSINSAILWTKQYVNGGASPIWRLNHFDKNLDVQQVSGNGSIVCMSNVTNALSEYWTIVPHQ